METLHSIQENVMGSKAIFEVNLSQRENVFMSVSSSSIGENHVVIVEADKFLKLWRNDPSNIHSEISHGDVESWRNDHKYGAAEKGFSHGFEDPVPLAKITFNKLIEKNSIYRKRFFFFNKLERIEKKILEYVSFTNGITRTIWLLSQGAECFPIICSSGGKELAKLAGYKKTNLSTISQLFIDT